MSTQIKSEAEPDISRALYVGLAIVILFFGGFFGWSAFAPLESAAIAPGWVTVDGQRKTIQHLEGGIIAEIRAREGQVVEQGEILIKLDDTKARAVLALLNGRYEAALAVESRLYAERDNAAKVSVPVLFRARLHEAKIAKILQNQTAIFIARRDSLAGQRAILHQRIAQYGEEIKGVQGQIKSETDQLQLIDEEIFAIDILYKKGLAKKPRLLLLKRQAAEIFGRRAMHKAQIARAKQSIGENRLRIGELVTQRNKEVIEQLKNVQAEVRDLKERLRASLDVFARTRIRAPLSGIVVGLKVHTSGGVIAPGSTLMDIVPKGDRLIIEARVEPKDIDIVHLGQAVKINLSAFNQRNTPPIKGNVVSVSADRLTDERTGRDYYRAEVSLPKVADRDSQQKLLPGMQAEVMIIAGTKTLLEYLFEPITKGFSRAFRES